MTCDQFMQYYKKCFFIKKFYVKCGLEYSISGADINKNA